MSGLAIYPYREVILDQGEVEVPLLGAEDYCSSEHLRKLIQQSVRDFTEAGEWFDEAIEEFCPSPIKSELNEKYIAPNIETPLLDQILIEALKNTSNAQ